MTGSMGAALERFAQVGLTATEWTSVVFYGLTALLLIFTYLVVRQDWSEIAAWISLGTVAVAIHFMLVAWHDSGSIILSGLPSLSPGHSTIARGTIKDCPECPEMVTVQSGFFIMGADDPEAGPNEGPLRSMMIGRRFAISKAAITAAEWSTFARATGAASKACAEATACLSWQDALAYAQWLGAKAGKPYRLPSAAEWEYAARGGAPAPSLSSAIPVVRASFAAAPAAPVANAFGLTGLTRKTSEFVDDCWSDTLAPLPSDGRAWNPQVGRCGGRVLKYAAGSEQMRFSGRREVQPGAAISGAAFRLVRELPAAEK